MATPCLVCLDLLLQAHLVLDDPDDASECLTGHNLAERQHRLLHLALVPVAPAERPELVVEQTSLNGEAPPDVAPVQLVVVRAERDEFLLERCEGLVPIREHDPADNLFRIIQVLDLELARTRHLPSELHERRVVPFIHLREILLVRNRRT
jgi:hypothetical protein